MLENGWIGWLDDSHPVSGCKGHERKLYQQTGFEQALLNLEKNQLKTLVNFASSRKTLDQEWAAGMELCTYRG
jgi:hypothetical protein